MEIKIKPEQLSDTVKRELDDYARSTTDIVKKAVNDAADYGVKELKATSPKRTGHYAKSWRKSRIAETSSKIEISIHAGLYQLTHLLENGHALRGGGRARAFPHIKPAEEKTIKKLEDDIERGVKHG